MPNAKYDIIVDLEFTKVLGKVLRELRHKSGMTQEQFEYETGIARETISRWESGAENPPTITSLYLLASAFKSVSGSDILAKVEKELIKLRNSKN